MGRRFAFAVNALSGEELSAGRADATQVYSVLCDRDLGACDAAGPGPLLDCATRAEFQSALLDLLQRWKREDQLIFYFSGHGRLKNGKYSLVFGAEPNESYLPFDSVTNDLQTHGVTRAIIILDACQSGAALAPGQKGADELDESVLPSLPQGIAVLASCRETESSYELDDGSESVFTHLLNHGIRTGLEGTITEDGMIGPADIIGFINARLRDPPYADYPQRPAFGIYSAEREVWLARNRTRAESSTQSSAGPAPAEVSRTVEELRLLYENTEKSRWPCAGAGVDDLDIELLDTYARANGFADPTSDPEATGRKLGFYSALQPQALHVAAVLCFCSSPHAYVPQARSVFTVGERTSRVFRREDVLGSLSAQLTKLNSLVQTEVSRIHRQTQYTEAQELFFDVVREGISNAITHRDYDANETVRVSVTFPVVEILSPGGFPRGQTFRSLIESEHLSSPNDAAIAWYLTTLLSFEGVGRGFTVFEEFLRRAGDDALDCEETTGTRFVKLRVRFPETAPALAPPPTLGDPFEPPPQWPALDPTAIVGSPVSNPPLDSASAADPQLAYPDLDHGPATITWPQMEQPYAPRPRPEAPSTQVQLAQQQAALEPGRHPVAISEIGGYRIESIIGEGANGPVYLAHDDRLDRPVVIKVLSKRFTGPDGQRRFLQEARLAARLQHPGIVRLFDVGEADDFYYLAMEYIAGRSLYHAMQLRAESGSLPRDFEWVATLCSQLCDALAHAHELGVIHRDIKPSNILLDADARPHITDFGISKDARISHEQHTVVGAIIGTPEYMAPEQAGTDVGPATDLYAVGVVMFELLTARLPFHGTNIIELLADKSQSAPPDPKSINPSIPGTLARICVRAIEPSPDARYASAQQLGGALRAYLETSGSEAGAAKPPPFWRRAFWHRTKQ